MPKKGKGKAKDGAGGGGGKSKPKPKPKPASQPIPVICRPSYRPLRPHGPEESETLMSQMALLCVHPGASLPEKLTKLVEEAAREGVPEVMDSIGTAYQTGVGLPSDQEAAARWFRKAAER
eukprot:RCo029026